MNRQSAKYILLIVAIVLVMSGCGAHRNIPPASHAVKKNIGMVVAIEMDSVLAKYGKPAGTVRTSGYELMRYDNEAYTLYVVRSGIGEISAAAATQFLITECKADVIVNFGVVGALTEAMKTTDVCFVEKVVHYDFECTGMPNAPRGIYPGKRSPWVETSGKLAAIARRVYPGLPGVVCASADKFVDSAAAKKHLRKEFGADICEMEAAGIAIVCERNGIPCLLVKSVSDSLHGGHKEFEKELARASAKAVQILDGIIREMSQQ